MGNVDISITVQLWQIVFSAFLGLVGVVSATFTITTAFVRRSECKDHNIDTNDKFDQLFNLVREIKENIGELKGKISK